MFKSKKFVRFNYVLLIVISLAAATFFVLKALEEEIVFFYSPSTLKEKKNSIKGNIRVGGLVKEKSVNFTSDGIKVKFSITDNKNIINVIYEGILPDLFRERQGVVVEGFFDEKKKEFIAKKVLAKHDENYMPPQVKKAIDEEYKYDR
ncbi:MAG: cytochrome c maturation protein CcmE [Rickettsiales bacterium]|nr:cytochrome c maturation protein CcmE [Rickettsiales bacterium]OUV81299.1 MAG: cytochrome c biogenesis protein CcmE [Rickettsiales bacterium TMED131]|tara:strand:- start:1641 stop:2084 length:444 start_codon:yes stop_codon:yes gene_type:complete